MIAALSVFVACILVILALLKWKHTYWTRRGVAQIEPTFLFGNFKEAVCGGENPSQLLVDAYREFKRRGVKHGGIYFTYMPIWMPVDPGLIKQILFKDNWYFASHGFNYKHKSDVLTNNLFNAEGDEWKALRSKLTPAFSSGKLKLMYDILDKVGDQLEKKVGELCQKDEPLDIKEVAACFGTDVIASCAFGLECNTLENPKNDFRTNGRSIFEDRFIWDTVEKLVNWDLLSLFGYTWMKKSVNAFFLGLVKDMIDYREKNKVTRETKRSSYFKSFHRPFRNDFLHILMQLRNKENVKDQDEKNVLTFEDVAANVFIIYAAGFETTSTTTSFLMYELARHPDIQQKVREEIWSLAKAHPNRQLTYDDLKEMKYCDMVIKETLRRHSTAPEVPRECTTNYTIPGSDIVIEKGTSVIIPGWAMHNDPDFYPNPEKFDPENFSEERTSQRPDVPFVPFGDGPRLCIGARFATMQIKLALSKYLMKYKYELNPKTPKEISYQTNNLTIGPKGDVLLDISEISPSLIQI